MSIAANQISFRYSPRFALEEVSIAAEEGSVVGVVGANGSGKSTLLKVLAGILPSGDGEILLDGQPLEGYTPSARARRLAYVPQTHHPAFEFSVEQMVLLGRIPHRAGVSLFERDADLAAAEEAIVAMDLEAIRAEPVTRISGGELQRTMLARALAQGAPTLLLDEPTSHLDIAHQQEVLGTIRQKVERGTHAAIISMHDLNLASIFSDTIVAMREGRVIAAGEPAEVLTVATLREVFGVTLHVEPQAYGPAPAIRYHDWQSERIVDR